MALRLRAKNEEQERRYAPVFTIGRQQRNERLSLLTFQALQMSRGNTILDPEQQIEWKDRLRSFATKGYSEKDVELWVWILSAEDGDSRIQRFLSVEQPKPIFMLLLLLRRDETIRQPESLASLIKYVGQLHAYPWPGIAYRGSYMQRKLSVNHYLIFLRRIVLHVQRIFPLSIVTVARLTAEYIKNIPLQSSARNWRRCRDGYTNRLMVFNTALLLFKTPARLNPVAHMEFNWRAQKILLAMSDNLERRLVVYKLGFRAIQQVMIGLKKSTEERLVAQRYAKTWPPYRLDFDGSDEKKTPEDDLSRSVRAGVFMTDEGYTKDDYDRALDNLGGTSAESPTIQTRSLTPKEWKGDKEEWNFFNRWAMKVRATRNATEAWRAFTRFSDKQPNFQVYAEMFLKLHAGPVDTDANTLPGDARETFPVHRANYTEYELARQSPPSITELYNQMINSGIKPEGYCLQLLVRNARTVEEGLRYLADSGIDPPTINALRLYAKPTHRVLSRIRLMVFSSYVQLLTRLQPTRRGSEPFYPEELIPIRHAIRLTRTRLVPGTTECATFRPPWHAVLRALSGAHICLKNGTRLDNNAEALSMFTDVLNDIDKGVGIDTEIFIFYCHAIQNLAVSRMMQGKGPAQDSYARPEGLPGSPRQAPPVPQRQATLDRLKGYFNRLTAALNLWEGWDESGREASGGDGEKVGMETPIIPHSVAPWHLHAYMRSLALLEDMEGMADAMEWALQHRTALDEAAARGSARRGPAMLAKSLCAFQAFARPALSPHRTAQLDELMQALVEDQRRARATGAPAPAPWDWRWPTPEEVDRYVAADARGASRHMRDRALAARWRPVRRSQGAAPGEAAGADAGAEIVEEREGEGETRADARE